MMTFMPANFSGPISMLELTSIRALVAYAAAEQKTNEELVTAMLKAKFSIEEITQLPGHAFDDAIRFLVDLQIDMALN